MFGKKMKNNGGYRSLYKLVIRPETEKQTAQINTIDITGKLR
jgi:hypothetical protein